MPRRLKQHPPAHTTTQRTASKQDIRQQAPTPLAQRTERDGWSVMRCRHQMPTTDLRPRDEQDCTAQQRGSATYAERRRTRTRARGTTQRSSSATGKHEVQYSVSSTTPGVQRRQRRTKAIASRGQIAPRRRRQVKAAATTRHTLTLT